MELESHCNKRQGTAQYESDKHIIAQFLNRFFKIEPDDFSENDILRICGVIQVRIRLYYRLQLELVASFLKKVHLTNNV